MPRSNPYYIGLIRGELINQIDSVMPSTAHEGNQFDAVALEYDFMAGIWHSPDFFLNNKPHGHQLALDLGCGSGLIVKALSAHFDRVIGIDLSYILLAIAQHKRNSHNIFYSQMNINNLAFGGQFDYIISKNVFHHLDDIPSVLEHLKHHLKPNGRLIVADVVSPNETPPRYVYIIGAFQEYLPNVMNYGLKTANRIFKFRTSKHWLDHLATDHYLSAEAFRQLYSQYLHNCTFPRDGFLIWDKPDERP